jgi:hypothetical protein
MLLQKILPLGKFTKNTVMAFTSKESIGSKIYKNNEILGKFYTFN